MTVTRTKKDAHLSRKFFHLFMGTVAALLYAHFLTRVEAFITLSVLMLLLLPGDLLRLRSKKINDLALKFFGPLMRTSETGAVSAQFFYLLGLFWLVFTPKVIAMQSILILAWMDPIASFCGLRFGKTKWFVALERVFPEMKRWPRSIRIKTIEGSLAGFLVAALAGVIAWTGPWASVGLSAGDRFWPSPLYIVFFSLFGAFVSVVAELWPTQWDDNLMIPFWTSLALWAVCAAVGIPINF